MACACVFVCVCVSALTPHRAGVLFFMSLPLSLPDSRVMIPSCVCGFQNRRNDSLLAP